MFGTSAAAKLLKVAASLVSYAPALPVCAAVAVTVAVALGRRWGY
jgi:hypothetical protein